MSHISREEIQLALKVSRAIQNYLDQTGDTMIRSTDVFPVLARKGLFEADKNNGLHFRRFLRKLQRHGELRTLVPQCTNVQPSNGEIFNEWYFHSAKDKMPKVVVSAPSKPIEKPKPEPLLESEAVDIIESLLEGYNPLTEEEIPDDEVVLLPRVQKALRIVLKRFKDLSQPKPYKTQSEGLVIPTREVDAPSLDLQPYKDTVESWGIKKLDDSFPEQIQEIRKQFNRAYEGWKVEEDEMLAELFLNDMTPQKIAEVLMRQPSAIRSRLNKNNLI